jgi:pSer/pThr/pTyr-binding forkhead associated (FHA) protein
LSFDDGVGLIALLGVIISAMVSAIVSRVIAADTAKYERHRRQSELALQIANLISSKDAEISRAAMRRFAIGIIRITGPDDHSECGKVYFIPMNSRVTVGRSSDNDIVLDDGEQTISRWHCGFISTQTEVWVDDFHSLNGTFVSGEKISVSALLADTCEITLGHFHLIFKAVRQNSILST